MDLLDLHESEESIFEYCCDFGNLVDDSHNLPDGISLKKISTKTC